MSPVRLRPRPATTASIEDGHLVVHSEQSPFGWVASDTVAEVRR